MDEMVAKAKDSATEFKDKSGDVLKKAKDGASDAAGQLKDKTSDALSSAKEKASNITQSAGNLMSMNGSAEITLDKPTKFPASHVRVVSLAPGKSVVQLKSYPEDGESTTFPAFFIQGTADVSLESLAGKTVPCKLFAQTKADGAVWQNVPGEMIQVKFSASENGVSAMFAGANLLNLETNTTTNSTGTFECAELK